MQTNTISVPLTLFRDSTQSIIDTLFDVPVTLDARVVGKWLSGVCSEEYPGWHVLDYCLPKRWDCV
jgi:hypothetical protein